jgi:hypothetical protein
MDSLQGRTPTKFVDEQHHGRESTTKNLFKKGPVEKKLKTLLQG